MRSEPHCCHCFPAANGETDRPELKLVTFVCPTAAGKQSSIAPAWNRLSRARIEDRAKDGKDTTGFRAPILRSRE